METFNGLTMSEDSTISITNTIRQFGKKLFGFVRGRVNSNEDAEDILQEVWYQLSNMSNLNDITTALSNHILYYNVPILEQIKSTKRTPLYMRSSFCIIVLQNGLPKTYISRI